MTKLSIIYHNASGKRNQMIIDMDMFFPCSKSWLTKLIKTVISRSEEPDAIIETIRSYLQDELDAVERREYKRDYSNRQIKWIRDCLDLIGGANVKQ